MVSKVRKWGNSLGVRLPKVFASELGVEDGSTVQIQIEDGAITIRPAKSRPRLAELVKGITRKNRHREVDLGPAVGEEAW